MGENNGIEVRIWIRKFDKLGMGNEIRIDHNGHLNRLWNGKWDSNMDRKW